MVTTFSIARIPEVYFGRGARNRIPQLIKEFGDGALVILGSRSSKANPRIEEILSILDTCGKRLLMAHIAGEPGPGPIDEIVQKYREKNIGLVIAIGGGSVLDAGKAVAIMLGMGEPVKFFLEGVGDGRKLQKRVIPLIAVPTTAGTGSEATKNSVLSEVGQNGYKRSLRDDSMIPDIAVIDPELCISCPKAVTAASGMDAFTQLLESFLSVKSNLMTDLYAWEGIQQIKNNLLLVDRDPENPGARSGMSYAAFLSGITLANAGLGVVHGFASAIGAHFNIPHGVVCGTLMAPANELTVKRLRESGIVNESLEKYANLGELFSAEKNKSRDYYIQFFTDHLWNITDRLNIPALSDFGITENNFDQIIHETTSKNNPVKHSPDELKEILQKRI